MRLGARESLKQIQDLLAQYDAEADKVVSIFKRQEFKQEIIQSLKMVRKIIETYDEEIAALRKKRLERKNEQAMWLERITKNEEERKRRQREENERLKAQREQKKKEREERQRAMRNPNAYKNVVQDERIRFARMTVEELAREKEETLAKRAPAIDLDSLTSEEAMKEAARDLYAKIVKAFGNLFDLQEKEKRQKYDIKELNTRIAALQAAKVKSTSDGKIKKISLPFGEQEAAE
ncbi:troponin T, cardiac muscle isoforms-like isoform X2 [Lytechinus variegatus]|uniref:troponin T, cardiac muscle isoforms-like isoform X2 n=1 Tax=Lytechinus variegatus TaxID=7654 RepID=UPI001BB2BB7D|nr:troponin T, cardiac muscle isoforms-like isoform X2 [Lytechinus variegatus]